MFASISSNSKACSLAILCAVLVWSCHLSLGLTWHLSLDRPSTDRSTLAIAPGRTEILRRANGQANGHVKANVRSRTNFHLFWFYFFKFPNLIVLVPITQIYIPKMYRKNPTLRCGVKILFLLPGREKLCPGKLTLGKILSEISGQYFYQDFKPRDRIFPAVF